jgi:homoserine kinase
MGENMRRVQVVVPAACTDLGPGIDSLGLALTLHNTVTMSLRDEAGQRASIEGEGGYPATMEHPALKAAMALFEAAGRPLPGIHVLCQGEIPFDAGLGDRAAWIVGGLFGANNLLETPMHRDKIAEIAFRLVERPAEAVTALLGGLTLTGAGEPLVYRRVELAESLTMVLVAPVAEGYREKARKAIPSKVSLPDAIFNLGRTALVAEALRRGDLKLLGEALHDRLAEPALRGLIPGFAALIEAARREGALAVAISGGGPALVIFARDGHARIEKAVREVNAEARTWVLNVDTQGVAINAQR